MNVKKDFTDFSVTVFDKSDNAIKATSSKTYLEAKTVFDTLRESPSALSSTMVLSGMAKSGTGIILANYRF